MHYALVLAVVNRWFYRWTQGTLSAIAATTATYLVFVFLFGCTLSSDALINDKLVEMRIAWPTPYLVAIGIYTYIAILIFTYIYIYKLTCI